jgi:hypothetical protein
VRVVACVDVGTRVTEVLRFGPYATGELTLVHEMRTDLEPGSLVLFDRGFAAYGWLWDVRRQGVDFVVRAKSNLKVVRLEAFGPGDALVEVTIRHRLRRLRPGMPKRWVLREITLPRRGAREPVRFFTSLLDAAISGREIAALYLRRWDEEGAVDEVKTHLGDAATVNRPLILRSRIPSRVEQEIYALLIAYNVVRRLMVDAAAATPEARQPVHPLRLSFTVSLERLREAVRDMMRLPAPRLPARYEELLQAVTRVQVPERPGRSYPRAVRIKMSNYPLKRRRAG